MLPYARPEVSDEEIAEVEATLRSGWLATGPRVGRLEEALASYTGSRFALCTSSGTGALHIALLAAGVGPGDEVVTTPMTWVATSNVILHCGARPVFVDVEPGTLNIDPTAVAEAVGPRTRAILPVHYAGLPCDEDALRSVADDTGVALVEDAAHALGATHRGRPIGSIADITMFSFHPAKNMTTGEGGAVTTDSPELQERMKRLRYHGIEQSPENRFGGRGPAAYEVVEAGFKYNMSDLQAALGIHQLARLDARNARRTELAGLYREALAEVPHVSCLGSASYPHQHAWHMMILQIDPDVLAIDRDDFIQALRDREIGAGLHYVPLHLQALYRPMAPEPEALPVATEAHRRILTLPLFPEMSEADVAKVVDAVREIVRANTRSAAAAAGVSGGVRG